MRGVFFLFKKVENGGGCEKEDQSSTQGALCTVSVFFTFYLFPGKRLYVRTIKHVT